MNTKYLIIVLPVLIGMVTPSLIILWVELAREGSTLSVVANDILYRQFAEGHNLFTLALFGLIPFVVLQFVLLSRYKRQQKWETMTLLACGLGGILALMIPGHYSVWSSVSSTAAIAFLFIPFYCLGSLLVGYGVGKVVIQYRNRNVHKNV